MKKIKAMTKCELNTFIREPMGALFIVFFPLIMFISTIILQGKEALSSTLPGNIGMTVSAAALLGSTINLAMNRENKVLKRFQTTTISPITIIIANYIVLCLFSLIGIILQFLFMILIKGNMNLDIMKFIADLLISSIYFFSMAFCISSYVKNVKSIHAISSTLFTIMMIFSGATFPIDNMPKITRYISSVLPLTQVNLLLINDVLGIDYKFRLFSYLYIGISIILFLIIGKKTFKWE